jgi:MFS family permease
VSARDTALRRAGPDRAEIAVFIVIASIFTLLLGIGILLMGLGLLGTSLGVRAVAEGFPDAVTGLVMSCYFAGFIAGSYLCPPLVRRVGHIRAFAAFAGTASACAFAHALLVEPFAWGLLRLVTGACLLGLYLVVESWLNLESPDAQRGRVLSIYMTVTLVALALGQSILRLDPTAGYPAFGVVAALFALGLVPVALTRLPEPRPVGVPHQNFRLSLRGSPLGIGGTLAAGLASSAFWGMGAVFAQRLGLDGQGVATFMTATILGGVALQWPIGHFSDHLDRRLVLFAVSLLAAAAALGTLVAALWWPRALYACAFLFGGLLFPIYSLSLAYLNDRIEHEHMLEASNAALLTYGGGAVVGPLAAGMSMHEWGAPGLFMYVAAVLLGFALFALVSIYRSRPVPERERTAFVSITRTSQAAVEMDPRTDIPELGSVGAAGGPPEPSDARSAVQPSNGGP